jgi:hypothetical protein
MFALAVRAFKVVTSNPTLKRLYMTVLSKNQDQEVEFFKEAQKEVANFTEGELRRQLRQTLFDDSASTGGHLRLAKIPSPHTTYQKTEKPQLSPGMLDELRRPAFTYAETSHGLAGYDDIFAVLVDPVFEHFHYAEDEVKASLATIAVTPDNSTGFAPNATHVVPTVPLPLSPVGSKPSISKAALTAIESELSKKKLSPAVFGTSGAQWKEAPAPLFSPRAAPRG